MTQQDLSQLFFQKSRHFSLSTRPG